MKKTICLLMTTAMLTAFAQGIVKVSSFAPKREDATAACQAALDSKAKTIVFDNPGFDYIVAPIFFHSNCEIVFEDGVVLRALKGAFKGRNDCLLTGRNVENVLIRGVGNARLIMNKKDYQNPALYRLGEWRHGISLLTAKNLTIRDLTILSSGGDGVYVSTDSKIGQCGTPCQNILLENLTLDDHHRQGISVISVNGLTIRKCRISNTNGTQPMCGIDFEPNIQDEQLLNCLVEDCEFVRNARAGVIVGTGGLKSPIQITVRNCIMKDNASGIEVNADWKPLTPSHGFIRFINCKVSGSMRPLVIRHNRKDLELSFKDCVIDNSSAIAHTEIYMNTDYTDDMDGLDFGNLVVRHAPKSRLAVFDGEAGAGLVRPKGSITVVSENGTAAPFDLDAFALKNKPNLDLLNFKTLAIETKNLVPATKKARKGDAIGLRDKALDFLQFADGTHPVNITFKTLWASKKAAPPRMPVEIFDPAGQSYGNFIINSEDFTYRFKPNMAGTFLFKVNTAGRSLDIFSDGPGQAYGSAHRLGMFRSNGRLYFLVPKGQKKITVEVAGEAPLESVEAKLRNPKGDIVATVPHKAEVQLLTYSRKDASKDELWSVSVHRVVEDCTLRLEAPLPPYFFTSPENALIAK